MTTATTKPATQKERLQAAAARSKKPIISLNNGVAIASSHRVAEFFGLPHDTLLHLYQAAQDRSINDPELAEFYLQNLKKPLFGNGYDLTREAFIHFSEPPQYGGYPFNQRANFIEMYDDFTANIVPTTPVIITAPAHYDDTITITAQPLPSDDLSILANKIRQNIQNADYHKNQSEDHQYYALVYAARAGDQINTVFNQLNHGDFIPWLEKNFTLSRVTANNYRNLAKEYPDLLSSDINVNSSLHFKNLTQAIALIGAPEEVKAEVKLKLESGEIVTAKEIRQLKIDHDGLSKDVKKLVDICEDHEKENIELQSDIESKAAEIARLEQELDELVKQGGVDALVSESTAVSQTKIDKLTSEITFLQTERTAAIERGVAIALLKKEQEVKVLDDSITAKKSTLETMESRISYRNKADTFNSEHQKNATTLLKALSAYELFISVTATPENVLLDHQAIKAITETAKKCQEMAEKMNSFTDFKQT